MFVSTYFVCLLEDKLNDDLGRVGGLMLDLDWAGAGGLNV